MESPQLPLRRSVSNEQLLSAAGGGGRSENPPGIHKRATNVSGGASGNGNGNTGNEHRNNQLCVPDTTKPLGPDCSVEVPGEEVEDVDGDFSWRKCLHFTGPGFLMCIAYIDPGNFESDLAVGASYGYKLIWVLLWSTVAGFVFQMLAVKLALVTRLHLARVCRHEYPYPFKIALWLATEVAIIASDIPEVIGTAFALKLLFGLPVWIGVIVTGVDTILFLGIQVLGFRKLEAFIGGMVGAMSICFLIEMCLADTNVPALLEGLVVPTISTKGQLYLGISILGAVVMPHNLYLHSALVLSRKIEGSKGAIKGALMYNGVESAFALGISLFINVAVVAVAAATIVEVDPSERNEIIAHPLENAPNMLQDVLGNAAKQAFGVALLASGQSSTMTGTYAGQFVMEGFLEIQMHPGLRNLVTRSVAIVPSLLCTLIAGEEGSEGLIIFSSVVLSFQLPFALLPLLKLTSSSSFMGPNFVNSMTLMTWGFSLATVVIGANLSLLVNLVSTSVSSQARWKTSFYLLGIVVFSMAYAGFLLYIIIKPVSQRTEELFPGSGRRVLIEPGGAMKHAHGSEVKTERESLLPVRQHMRRDFIREEGHRGTENELLLSGSLRRSQSSGGFQASFAGGTTHKGEKGDSVAPDSINMELDRRIVVPPHFDAPVLSQTIGTITRDFTISPTSARSTAGTPFDHRRGHGGEGHEDASATRTQSYFSELMGQTLSRGTYSSRNS